MSCILIVVISHDPRKKGREARRERGRKKGRREGREEKRRSGKEGEMMGGKGQGGGAAHQPGGPADPLGHIFGV